MKIESPYYTTREVSIILRCSTASVIRWCKSGKIAGAFQTVGDRWLIPKDSPSIHPPESKPKRTQTDSPYAGLSPAQKFELSTKGKILETFA